MGIDEAERNLRSGFPYCGYKEKQPAGSRLQICCNVISATMKYQSEAIARQSDAGRPYHPRAGFSRLRGMLMAAGGRATYIEFQNFSHIKF